MQTGSLDRRNLAAHTRATNRQRALVILGIAAGIAFIAIAIMYWTVPPKSLPLPNLLGHEDGVSAVHVKHGIASFLVGLACFVFAWFQSGPRHRPAKRLP